MVTAAERHIGGFAVKLDNGERMVSRMLLLATGVYSSLESRARTAGSKP